MAQTKSDESDTKVDRWIGRLLADRFEIEELIGEGGMGRVYRGRQYPLDRPVAIKCVHSHLSSCPEVVSSFMREARLASQLAHPNIVRIYDFGRTPVEDGGELYIVMELLEGSSLASVLATNNKVPLQWGIAIVLQTLTALAEAHAAGITHYDIKPENIFLERRRGGNVHVKVIDFGVARSGDVSVEPARLMGTPHYMSPEQVRGDSAEISADLYAVGALLFQILTGRVVFDGASAVAVLQSQLQDERPDPRTVAPERDIPAYFADICMRALALNKAERFQSAEDFYEALAAGLTQLPAERPSKPAAVPTLPSGPGVSTLPTLPDLPYPVRGSTRPRSARYRYVLDRKGSNSSDDDDEPRLSGITEIVTLPNNRLAKLP